MRGIDVQPRNLFSYIHLEQRVPADHPLRSIRQMVDTALGEMDKLFTGMYSEMGQPSIAPERLLRAASAGELLSKEHFSADGILLDAAASIKSFRRKDTEESGSDEGPKSELHGTPVDREPQRPDRSSQRQSGNWNC